MLTKETVEGFVKTVLAKNFDHPAPVPECHKEWWDLCCSKHRYVAIAAPRGFAKSTAITHSYLLAALLFRDRKFAVIVSDTEGQAVMFLQDLKQELLNNDLIADMFHLKRGKDGDVELWKDSETDIIVECQDGYQFRVVARGAGQRVRGLKWGHNRPDIVVCDDLENDEIVLNKDRRAKFKQWFTGALLPCLSDRGIVRVVGTILHMDSLLENLMPNRQLAAVRQANRLVREELKEWTPYRLPWRSIRYRAHNPDFSCLLWPEKKPKEVLEETRAGYIAQGVPEVYAQEYLNVPLDESFSYFRRSDFIPMTEEDRKTAKKRYITMDLAISEDQQADYTVALVAGMDENGILHVENVIRDRIDGKEIVELILQLQKFYQPEWFGVEEGAIRKSIYPFLQERMRQEGIFPNFFWLKPDKDKLTRARSIQGRLRANAVKFDKNADWYQDIEDECVRFPRDKHDDQVDALAWMGLMVDKLVEAPTVKEMEEEAYEEEYAASGLLEQGRSIYTGY